MGISIHFEKENIDTDKVASEQVATIYSAFSQMESQKHSNNMRIRVKIRMEKGAIQCCPIESEGVSTIYTLYLEGVAYQKIAEEMMHSNIRYHSMDETSPYKKKNGILLHKVAY